MTPHNDCPSSSPSRPATSTPPTAFKIAQEVVDLDMLANTFMRAPGESVGTFALECAIDELAERAAASTRSSCGRANRAREGSDLAASAFSSRHLVEA